MFKCFSLPVLFFLAASATPQNVIAHKSPLGLTIDHAGNRAYVALHTAAAVAEVDLKVGKVLREIPVDRGPFDVAQSGDSLFVSCEQDGTLVRIDLKKNAVVERWKIGQAPRGVAAVSGGARVFVACHDDKSVCALDVASGKLFSVVVPGWPERLALDNSLAHPQVLALLNGMGEALVAPATS